MISSFIKPELKEFVNVNILKIMEFLIILERVYKIFTS